MSLLVWLPLIKENDLQNRGLLKARVTNNGMTYNSNGKIGGCYSGVNASKQYMVVNDIDHTATEFVQQHFSGHSFSLAAWSNATAGPLIGVTYAIRLKCGQFMVNNASCGALSPDGKWHHYCGTYDVDTGLMTTYIDGVQKATKTLENFSTSYSNGVIGIGKDWNNSIESYHINGSISDVRIYDNCLSPKEVKELSKGLVLHYGLDDGYVESTDNKLPYPEPKGVDSRSYAIDPITVNNWSVGYNSGVTDSSIGTHAYWRLIDGIPTMVFPDTNSSIGKTHRWLGIHSSSSNVIPEADFTTGVEYTLSFDAMADVEGKQVKLGLYILKDGSTSMGFYDGQTLQDVTTNWARYSATFTHGGHTAGSYLCIYVYGMYGTEGTSYVRNVQLEIKDHSTPYAKTSRTPTTIYDMSGYQNNGTIIGSLQCSSDTPRNEYSTYFSGTSNVIKLPVIQYSNFTNYSISWWAKGIVNMMWGLGDGNRLSFYYGKYANTNDGSGNPFYSSGTTVIVDPRSSSGFVHYVMTGDGTSLKLYVNGQLYGTAKTYKELTGTQIYINGRSADGAYGGQEYVSDFRIYATTLSTDDIKELYDTAAIVDNKGNDWCYTFKETSTGVNITDKGIIDASQINENNENESEVYETSISANQIIEI